MMATVLAAVWDPATAPDRRLSAGCVPIFRGSHSLIYTFKTISKSFENPPHWGTTSNTWVVCESVEQFRKVWKDEALVRAFEGKIPMPAYYEIEEYLTKNAPLVTE